MLIYVMLHELSHALMEGTDVKHETPEYHSIFQNLLDRAAKAGIYDPTQPIQKNYCGYT